MKAVSLALLLFFALFALSTKLEPTRADYVYDTKGNPLLSGASYYASYYHPGGGLVKPAQIDDETKPISVVLGPILENQKWPVKFIVHGDETTVTTDSSLDIEFTTAPSGVSSTRWSVGKDYLVRIDSQDQALKGISAI
ncbi:hypothetical protein L6164_002432 [Bauhinia variegata]|uniref:Uncharacterized protein n=1 Tax=Bauhinia variegata TaxID=167791 RepID=A0ACB9PY83_BAUVA|nr:hypothetical protein L6164_002432 [Bauhinia variegata]